MDFNSINRKKLAVLILSVILLVGITVGIFRSCSRQKTEPIVMPQEQTTDTTAVKKQLGVSQDTAEKITREIRYIQSGDTKPNVTYYVTAPTVETAAEQVAKDIKEGQPTVPKEAAQKSDRTVVTADKEKQKVDVYKINLNKSHKIKAGVMYAGDRTYYGVGYQQGKWEGMVYTRDGRGIQAGSITYTIAEW